MFFLLWIIIIILIGFSRLYLGVHYVSDVWGGYLVGAIWLIISISFTEYFLYKKQKVGIDHSSVKKQLMADGIILVSISLYIIFAINYEMPAFKLPQGGNQIVVKSALTIFDTEQLKHTETLLGQTQEPLSFVIIAKNDQKLIDLFEQAGWILADEVSIFSTIKLAYASLWKESYPKAPMTPDFWDANVHDFGFEKSTDLKNIRIRHHARFWRTNYVTENGDIIYVGTASFDRGTKLGLIHSIDPNIDKEREFLFNDLNRSGIIKNFKKHKFVDPKLGKNFSGDPFFTDGELYLINTKEE